MTRGKERQRAEESGSLESMVFSKDFAPQNAARHRLRRGEQCQAADILIGLGRTPEGEVAVDRIVVHYGDQLCVFAQHELQDLYARCVSKACRRVRKEGSDDRYRHQRARITKAPRRPGCRGRLTTSARHGPESKTAEATRPCLDGNGVQKIASADVRQGWDRCW